MSDLTVANEIRRQLGGQCLFMLGAQHLIGSDNSLSFRIRGSTKINGILITLNAMDTYDVEFVHISRRHAEWRKVVSSHKDIYADQLHELIRRQTGLETSVPKILVRS